MYMYSWVMAGDTVTCSACVCTAVHVQMYMCCMLYNGGHAVRLTFSEHILAWSIRDLFITLSPGAPCTMAPSLTSCTQESPKICTVCCRRPAI